ncbi:IS110 family transposase [uncultured Actinomyces sp.]|jgi:transposase IS116/IS110/IS902 family protein|uniref:IS110 family transposase n=1 Tax=uncultured Actinomyces sp. TaxID=249061 RepID=UPI0028D4C7B4|nr:IS110 family transposase [uncultured Actinomyces sp.]
METEGINVFIGIDAGKSEHWATALSRNGRKVLDKALPNNEDWLRALYEKLATHGSLLVVVPARHHRGPGSGGDPGHGHHLGYLPRLSMRRIADLTPGSTKTDTRDTAIIASAARTMPHTLSAINTSDENAAALSMLTDLDPDPARQINQTKGRIRGLYTQIHPALEAAPDPWLEHDAVPEVIAA